MSGLFGAYRAEAEQLAPPLPALDLEAELERLERLAEIAQGMASPSARARLEETISISGARLAQIIAYVQVAEPEGGPR